jgi:hypothetical protein
MTTTLSTVEGHEPEDKALEFVHLVVMLPLLNDGALCEESITYWQYLR